MGTNIYYIYNINLFAQLIPMILLDTKKCYIYIIYIIYILYGWMQIYLYSCINSFNDMYTLIYMYMEYFF